MNNENQKIERHPFTPFLPDGCKAVMCGTFPPTQDKWAMDFFYPNFQNDMWRIFGLFFFNNKEHFFDRSTKTIDKAGIQRLLGEVKVGVGETATEVVRTRGNASDKFLEIIKPVDLARLLQKVPECEYVVTTGEKAASVIASLTDTPVPKMGDKIKCCVRMENGTERYFYHWRMPSTSRAYPMKLEKKAEYYAELFKAIEGRGDRC